MPKVSVILPTYNRAKLISRSIGSVLSQDFSDLELLIIDDGSADDTEKIVRGFPDRRIRYVRNAKNKGAAFSRNLGIKLAEGDYIAFQDSDDEWLPHKLKKQVRIFEEVSPKADIVYTNMLRVSPDKTEVVRPETIKPEDGIIYKDALDNKVRSIGIQTALFKRRCFELAGGFDETFPRWIDFEFFINVSRYSLFYHLDEETVKWNETAGSISLSRDSLIIARKLLVDKYYDDFLRYGKRCALADHLYGIGHALCQKGEMKEGRKYIFRAIRVCPNFVKALAAVPVMFFGPRFYNALHKF